MTDIKDIYEDMELMLNQIESKEVLEDVKEAFVPFKKNEEILFATKDMEQYLIAHKNMCDSQEGLLECFDTITTEELKTYIATNNINLEELKIQTLKASAFALEELIFQLDEDEY